MKAFKAFLIRFAELVLVNCILSAIVTTAFTAGELLNTRLIPLLLIFSADAVFLAVQWARLRVLCFEVQDLRLYFRIALSSFAAFAVLNLAFCAAGVFLPDVMVVYTWLFITAKFFSIATNYAVSPMFSNIVSAVLFELLLLGMVFLAPLHRRIPDADERIPLDRDVREFKR